MKTKSEHMLPPAINQVVKRRGLFLVVIKNKASGFLTYIAVVRVSRQADKTKVIYAQCKMGMAHQNTLQS
jgi:hypothetical protein